MAKTALITGANGISGCALIERLCSTTSDDWGSIIVTSRSSFRPTVSDPRIKFIALDFLQDVPSLVEQMKEVCGPVSHAYFCSYILNYSYQESYDVNKTLFDNFISALDKTAPNLENVTLQTGSKYYNSHIEPVPSPAKEDDPRRYGIDENFYFAQEDELAQIQRGKAWSWNVIRPQGIIGTNAKPYGINNALTIAVYLLICRELSIPAPMPTNQLYWEGLDDVSDTSLIADLTVFASTRKSCANEAFNISNGDSFSWRHMWPRLAASLGAKADSNQRFQKAAPRKGEVQLDFTLGDWSKDKRKAWDDLCDRRGLPGAKATFDLIDWEVADYLYMRTWSTTLSMDKARQFGWTGHIDTYDSFVNTFEKFRKLKIIPK